MNFLLTSRLITTLGKLPGVGARLRRRAYDFPDKSVVTIRHGLARGLRWRRHRSHVNGYWIGHYETPVQEALQRWLKPGDTFFDIGAHAGFFTLVASRLVGPMGRCVAFDASVENCAIMSDQFALNSLPHVRTIHAALAERTGRISFSAPTAGACDGHLSEGQRGELEEVVPALTLDEATTHFGPAHFIKIDVEGAEARVLHGAGLTLRRDRPGLLLEVHHAAAAVAVQEILAKAGYTLRHLNGSPFHGARVFPFHLLARLEGGCAA